MISIQGIRCSVVPEKEVDVLVGEMEIFADFSEHKTLYLNQISIANTNRYTVNKESSYDFWTRKSDISPFEPALETYDSLEETEKSRFATAFDVLSKAVSSLGSNVDFKKNPPIPISKRNRKIEGYIKSIDDYDFFVSDAFESQNGHCLVTIRYSQETENPITVSVNDSVTEEYNCMAAAEDSGFFVLMNHMTHDLESHLEKFFKKGVEMGGYPDGDWSEDYGHFQSYVIW